MLLLGRVFSMARRSIGFLIYFAYVFCHISASATKCGRRMTGFIGFFTSPGYPENYGNNKNCNWVITSTEGTRIQLRFTDVSLEKDKLCQNDYIEIFDGPSAHSPLLGRFCGKSIRNLIVSTSNQMYVTFSTDGSDTFRGFEASWLVVGHNFGSSSKRISKRQNQGQCGRSLLTAKSGILTTPNFGDNKKYPAKLKCIWVIKTDSEHVLNLEFMNFDLEPHSECRYDYITVDGTQIKLTERFCGDKSPNTILKSRGDEITISFTSDGSTQRGGFKAKWWTTKRKSVNPSECDGKLTGESGTITSPSYPQSSSKQILCTWQISVPEGGRILFEFIDLNIQDHQSCSTGYVQISDRINKDYETLGVYCGHIIPAPIRSSSNTLQIGFLSDKNSTTRGFRAKWKTVYKTDETDKTDEKETPCNSILRQANGHIYQSSSKTCKWTIELPPNKRAILSVVSVNLADDPMCSKDVLQAKDSISSSTLFKTCGNLKPLPVMSFTNRVEINRIFTDEPSVLKSNFKIRWESIDSDLNNNIFDTGSCLTSSVQGIKFALDGKNRKNIQPDHIPWMVQLHSPVHCAGAILSPEWVVSAAHCFIKMPMISSWLVRAGDPNLFSEDGSEQIVKIREIFFHPKFNSKTWDNDVVLLRLKDKLTFNSKVRSICLPMENTVLSENQECSISGWGTSKYLGKPREKLFQVFPKLVDYNRCNGPAMYKGRITSNMICAGQGGYDSCQGDGGSPLVCVNGNQYFAVGLASWGNGCAGKHGVYTDLRKQVSWIKSVMERNQS